MTREEIEKLGTELADFLDQVTAGMGRTERIFAMRKYIEGLLLDGERKSVQPIALRLADNPEDAEALRQRIQQCVVVAAWEAQEMFDRLVKIAFQRISKLEALVIDDTGFPKKGTLSPGVCRQYSGTMGRVENCQVATSLHAAGENKSSCLGMQLFFPEEWTSDRKRRLRAQIPPDLEHQEKWRIALNLIKKALAAGAHKLPVLADAGYGNCLDFRLGIRELGLHYLVSVDGRHLGWPPGAVPIRPTHKDGQNGRPQTRDICEGVDPMSFREIANTLEFQRIKWRNGSKGQQTGWFAATRIYSAERRTKQRSSNEELWLICEWRKDSKEPNKFYISSLPKQSTLTKLVRLLKLRWRVERDYQEMKGELGLDHYEGRTWRGMHHHFALCAAAHLFLALTRESFSPSTAREVNSVQDSTASSRSVDPSLRTVSFLPDSI